MLDEWLVPQIASRNFSVIYDHVVKDDSLSMFCGTIAKAIYKEIDDPEGDRKFCLSVLQAMLDRKWRWSNVRADIHGVLPLHRQLEMLNVPGAERNQFYGSAICVSAPSTLGIDMTLNELHALLKRDRKSSFPGVL